MTDQGRSNITLAGQRYSIDYWDASARNTFSPATSSCGEWCLYLEGVSLFYSGPVSPDDPGEISFDGGGQLALNFRDRPGWAPFVVMRLRELQDGLLMQIRYLVALSSAGDPQWSDWYPMTWDENSKDYRHLGPTSDGTIAQADGWGQVQISSADSSGFDVRVVRAGWAMVSA